MVEEMPSGPQEPIQVSKTMTKSGGMTIKSLMDAIRAFTTSLETLMSSDPMQKAACPQERGRRIQSRH